MTPRWLPLFVVTLAAVAHADVPTGVPTGTVQVGTPVIVGPMTADVARRQVYSHMGEMRHCYEQQLTQDPLTRGTFSVHMRITASTGAVASAVIASGTMHVRSLAECIVRAIRRTPFPPPAAQVELDLPFTLTPTGRQRPPDTRHGLI